MTASGLFHRRALDFAGARLCWRWHFDLGIQSTKPGNDKVGEHRVTAALTKVGVLKELDILQQSSPAMQGAR